MLHHIGSGEGENPAFACKCHGFTCPNEKDKLHSRRPIDENGMQPDLATPTARLYELTSATCPILSIFAHIGLIRRAKTDDTVDARFDGFLQVLRDNIWYFLERAHVRILVSIMESFADHRESSGAGTAACAFIRMERIARMVSEEKEDLRKKSLGIIEGMRSTCVTAPDAAINLFRRLHSILYWHPLLWLVFYEILKFDLEAPDHTFKRCDNLKYYEVYDFPESKIVTFVKRYLQPSTANTKYLDLYSDHHQKHLRVGRGYGGGWNFPDRDVNFLLAHGCSDIIDFGCGLGNKNNAFFTWTKYDPSVPKYSTIPYRSHSGLISYDVLEHIPENELPITAEWLELLASRCMVLGISTRPAGEERGTLPNGENAHCTVHSPEWWITRIEELLPEFEVLRSFPSNNYVVLHLKRLPRQELATSS